MPSSNTASSSQKRACSRHWWVRLGLFRHCPSVVSLHWWPVNASCVEMQLAALACGSGLRSPMIPSPRTLLLCTVQSKLLQNHTAWRLCASSRSSMPRGDCCVAHMGLTAYWVCRQQNKCRTVAACICRSAESSVSASPILQGANIPQPLQSRHVYAISQACL
jgi:hypothetical protein